MRKIKLGDVLYLTQKADKKKLYKETAMGDFLVLKISREEIMLFCLRSWNKYSMTPKEFKERYNWRWAK